MTQTHAGELLVRRYLDAVASHDWEEAGGCLTADVRRTGPFGDVYEGRGPYLDYLAGLMPTLSGYGMEIQRVLATADGTTVVAELVETVEMDGKAVVTPESLTFDLGPDGRIHRIGIFIQQLP